MLHHSEASLDQGRDETPYSVEYCKEEGWLSQAIDYSKQLLDKCFKLSIRSKAMLQALSHTPTLLICHVTYHRLSFRMKLSNLILVGNSLLSTFSVKSFGSNPKDRPSFCHHRALGSTSCCRRCINFSGKVSRSSSASSSSLGFVLDSLPLSVLMALSLGAGLREATGFSAPG